MAKQIKREYKPAKGRGHGPGRVHEKPKDFKGTWKKLIQYCQKYVVVMAIAIVCAIGGTVLTLVGPDKLSDLTNIISNGIQPNTEIIQEISTEMTSNISKNMSNVLSQITNHLKDEVVLNQKINEIMNSNISDEDKNIFNQNIQTMNITNMPTSVLEILLNDLNEITVNEQIQFIQNTQDFTKIPTSIMNLLFTEFTIENVVITTQDQIQMMNVLSNMGNIDVLEQLPTNVYELVKPTIDMDKVLNTCFILVGLYALSFIMSAVQNWTMASVTQRVSYAMREDISKKINRLPIYFYNKTTTGDVLSRVTNDVDTIGHTMNSSLATLATAIVMLFGSLFMMIKTNGLMTLTAVGSTLIGFIFMFSIMGKSQKYFMKQQNTLGNINGYIEEMYTGQTIVKAYNGEKQAISEFVEMNNELKDAAFKAQVMSGLMGPLMGFIGNFGYVAVCVVGSMLTMSGKIEFGVIVAFMLYVRYFTNPLQQIAQAMQSLQSAAAAGERVFDFLEAEEMEDESKKQQKLETIEGHVEFEHVRFGYEDSDRIVIHDFNAIAKPGQKIAIVGPTGAGKTTMVNLLMRFHEIHEGNIKIDGVSIQDLPRENVREQFCMVLQDTWLFEGTIRENLIYSTKNVSEEKMVEACKAVGLDHFVRTLPQGYDTVLNDLVNLSQGQKQQLIIARAMIADRPMLILDEATSSVDTRTELLIQEAMDKLMENRTSFVIAHRLSTIKNADMILVVKDGDIVERGNHKELLEKNGFYADLYNSQFETND